MAIINKKPNGNGLVISTESKLRYKNKELKKRIEELEKQLSIHGVVTSLLCVDNKHSEGLTLNKKYKLIAETEDYFGLINNNGELKGYCKWRFKKL